MPTPRPHPDRRPVPLATILTVFAIALVLAAIWAWSRVLLLAFAAILLAIALRGGARVMHNRLGLPFRPGVLITAAGSAGLVALLFVYTGPAISKQFNQLLDSLPDAWKQVSDWMDNSSIGSFVEQQLGGEGGDQGQAAGGSLSSAFQYLRGTITTMFGTAANIVLLITMAIFLALDAGTYRDGFLRLVPMGYRDRARDIMDETGTALARWMGGQALDMLIVALLTGAGLWLLGVPLALVLGVIAGITNVIPVIGPFMSGVPAVLFAMTQGVDKAIYVTILFVVIQQIEGNILMPMIQKYAAHLPPVLTVIAIVAFGSIFGLSGIILATPLLLVAIILVQRIYVEDILGDRDGKRG